MNQSREKTGWIVGILGLVIALFAWLVPFNPIGPSPLSPEETVDQQEAPVIAPTLEPVESPPEPDNAETSPSIGILNSCSGNDWENCWLIDDQNYTMTWNGMQDSYADIGQGGEMLRKIREGYTAIFTIEDDMKINICTGRINGTYVKGDCPIIIDLKPGAYQVVSSGESGGFRVTKDGK